jgi:SAM-dependent methyltransferase
MLIETIADRSRGRTLMNGFVCPICKGTERTTINSYKHYWHSCDRCENIFRERKPRYLIPAIVPNSIGQHIPFHDSFYPVENVIQQESQFYDYYANITEEQIRGSKWEAQALDMARQLSERGIELAGKRVLDISGGPGHVIKTLPGISRDSVVTEYSQVAVDGMLRNFGINAVQYDFNADNLHEKVSGTFDIVFIRYSINYCRDVPRFLASLKPLLASGAFVYVIFLPPTLGYCLRRQHDEYDVHALYRQETMEAFFGDAGFGLVCKYTDGDPYFYLSSRSLTYNLYVLPYTIAYTLAALTKHASHDLFIRNLVNIYRT